MSYELTPGFEGELLAQQSDPLDLRFLSDADASEQLYKFIQFHYGPGNECSLFSPSQSQNLGYGPFWQVTWESGPRRWGRYLAERQSSIWYGEFELPVRLCKPEVLLSSYGDKGARWYALPWYYFDVRFVPIDVEPEIAMRIGD